MKSLDRVTYSAGPVLAADNPASFGEVIDGDFSLAAIGKPVGWLEVPAGGLPEGATGGARRALK